MKTVSRIISAAVFVLLLTLLMAFAKTSALVFTPIWQPFSERILAVIGSVTGGVSFPVWEVIAALLLIWLVTSLIHAIRHLKLLRWLSGLLWGVCLGVLLFFLLWGAGLFLPAKTEHIVSVREYSAAELREAALYYGEQASETAKLAPRDRDGNLLLPAWDELSEEANTSFDKLSALYPEFSGDPVPVKPLFGGSVFRYLGAKGVFVPFTAEASADPGAYAAALPMTLCRTLAQRRGAYGAEDAEFCAFLACERSDDPLFRYAADYAALMCCYRALRAQDEALAAELWKSLPPLLQADILGADAHEAPYQGKVQEAAQKVTDAYIAALEQQGVRSYGKVSDALIAWYQTRYQKTGN
ncbi:MAG: DUF3810 family protein [Oscillospiraceae bacterium]|nr:DUF3810 family protein [Oscillospiraceae bacterium]